MGRPSEASPQTDESCSSKSGSLSKSEKCGENLDLDLDFDPDFDFDFDFERTDLSALHEFELSAEI